jgi:Zn-dependent alcohol dehydrogenase
MIRGIAGADGVDCFIDNTGATQVIELGYRMTKGMGRVILVGVPRRDQNISIHSLPFHFGKVLAGSHGGESTPQSDIPRYIALWRAGRISLSNLVTDVFPLDKVNEAIHAVRTGQVAGRCLLDLDPSRPAGAPNG